MALDDHIAATLPEEPPVAPTALKQYFNINALLDWIKAYQADPATAPPQPTAMECWVHFEPLVTWIKEYVQWFSVGAHGMAPPSGPPPKYLGLEAKVRWEFSEAERKQNEQAHAELMKSLENRSNV